MKVTRKKICEFSIITVSALALSQVAQASDYYQTSAPITYKLSQPGSPMGLYPDQAPLNMGYQQPSHINAPVQSAEARPQQRQLPSFLQTQPNTAPAMAPTMRQGQQVAEWPQPVRPQTAPRPQTQAPSFDLSNIDETLYKHQKVGNPYTVLGKTYKPEHQPDYDRTGTASWYGDKFHGKLTANGETYDKNALTAAHKTLPLNSYVIVTNINTGKSLKLRLNDRGPFIGDRIIDLSEAAAKRLGIASEGLGEVRVQYAGPADPNESNVVAQLPAQPASQPVLTPVAPLTTPKAPELGEPGYQPLRDLPQPQAEPVALPQAFEPAPVAQPAPEFEPAPVFEQSSQAPITAPQVMVPNIMLPVPSVPRQSHVPIPEAYNPPAPGEEDITTLTIKGPIHLAGYKTVRTDEKVILAVHEDEKK